MVAKTQLGITVEAFQWTGGSLINYTVPIWLKTVAVQDNGDGTLSVPCANGVFSVRPGDWIFQSTSGYIYVLPVDEMDVQFS